MNVGAGVVDRTIRLEKGGLTVVVVGNFGLVERTSTPPLSGAATWYDMVGPGTLAGGATVTLQPGEWRVYANQDLGVPTAGEETTGTAARFALDAVFPNPTTGRATVRYTLAAAGDVRLEAYDVLGRRVAVLAEGPQACRRPRGSARRLEPARRRLRRPPLGRRAGGDGPRHRGAVSKADPTVWARSGAA